jgi:hypothetical protein
MAQGLDYAFAHPNLDCVAGQGYTFVARYVGDPDPNPLKYLDAPELAVIRSLGLSVVAVRETSAGFMLTESGAQHAQVSRAHCNALGLHGIPIFYALDVDPRGFTSAQKAAVTRFLQDAASVDGGRDRVGLYGSDDAIDAWVGTSYCRWGWQTYAWSAGRVSPKAHFRQYRNGVALCGGTVDLNETYTTDFGQWPRPQEGDVTPEQDQILRDTAAIVHSMHGGNYLTANGGDLSWLDQKLQPILDRLAAVESKVAAGVPVDAQAIADAVGAELAPILEQIQHPVYNVTVSGSGTATPAA